MANSLCSALSFGFLPMTLLSLINNLRHFDTFERKKPTNRLPEAYTFYRDARTHLKSEKEKK